MTYALSREGYCFVWRRMFVSVGNQIDCEKIRLPCFIEGGLLRRHSPASTVAQIGFASFQHYIFSAFACLSLSLSVCSPLSLRRYSNHDAYLPLPCYANGTKRSLHHVP